MNTLQCQEFLNQPLSVGGRVLRNRVALAPMAGMSDVPMRQLAWEFGAGHVVSEMVGSKPQLWDTGKSRLRRVPVPGVDPQAVQIAGNDPAVMAQAAAAHVAEGVEWVDINFGCPAKKVCRKAAGSALLGQPDLVGRIVEAVNASVDVPVSVKLRTGLVPGDDAGRLAAEAAEQAGAVMVVAHARSRACRFVGAVNYEAVAAIKDSISVPLLVNGDITGLASAREALNLSGADGVMIGRAAMGSPWIFQELLGAQAPTLEQAWAVCVRHVELMHSFYGELDGLRIARKHIAAYLEKFGNPSAISELVRVASASEQLQRLRELACQESPVAA